MVATSARRRQALATRPAANRSRTLRQAFYQNDSRQFQRSVRCAHNFSGAGPRGA